MTFKWVSLSIFPSTRSNLNLEIKKRLNFNDFSWQAIFEIFLIWTKYEILEQISLTFPFLKHLQVINPSFVTFTKPLSNKIIEKFCEGLKWMCKLFEENEQKRFIKTCNVLQIFKIFFEKHFIIELALGTSYRLYLA